MPAKSLIDIDVNDASFKQFNALFQQFQTGLKSMPGAWQNIERAQQKSVKGFRDLVGQQAAAIGQQNLLGDSHRNMVGLLKQEESIWERIRRSNKGAATIVKDITADILKWTPVLSALAGLGGLAGISALAGGVAGGRRSALGLGASYGGQKAFDTAFDRFVDTGSVLSGVASSRGDVSKSAAFSALGMLNAHDMKGDDAAVSARVLERAKRLADKTSDQLLGTMFSTYQLGSLGLSEDDFRRLKHTSPEEMARQQGAFGKLSRDYSVGEGDQRAYQDLISALKDAGNQIDTVFVKGLVPLVNDGSINELSKSVVDLVKAFSETGILKEAIHDVTDAMRGLADFMKDPLGSTKKSITNDILREGAAFKGDAQHFWNFWNRGFGTGGSGSASAPGGATFAERWPGGGLPMKAGAGRLDPGLAAFAQSIRGKVASFDQITAGEDDYHKGFKSAHNDGRAFDFTIKNPADAAVVADLVRTEMAKQGIKGRVIDEYNHPSKNATGGHIHVQTDVRVMNAAGSNVIVQAQQVAPSP
jgi:hypothetical protein